MATQRQIKQPDPVPDSTAVMDAIRKIVHALHVGSRAAEKHMGLSGAQLFVLQTLASGSSMSVNELAERTHTHQSSVSVVISRLIEAKLVSRAVSRVDARRAEVSVTAAGRKLLRTTFITPQQRLLRALNELEPARLSIFRGLLEEVLHISALDDENAPMFFERSAGAQSK